MSMGEPTIRLRRWNASITLFACTAVLLAVPTYSWAKNSNTLPSEPVLVVQAGTSSAFYVLWSRTCDRDRHCYAMTRSLDGGHTFSRVSAPPVTFSSDSPGGNIVDLNFANADDGLALTNDLRTHKLLLFATFDGGRSWHRETSGSGERIYSLTSTPSSFYAVTDSCTTTTHFCRRFQLDRSPASSLHWTTQSVTPIGGRNNSNAPSVAAFGHDVWLTTQEQVKPYLSQLATSYDDGRTFVVTSEPSLNSVNGCDVTATSSITLWAQCDEGMMTGYVMYSDDGGSQWTTVEGEPERYVWGSFDPVSSFDAVSINGDHMNQLERLNASTRMNILTGRSPTPGIRQLTFVTTQQGVALGQGNGPEQNMTLYETSNAGKSWRVVHLSTRLQI